MPGTDKLHPPGKPNIFGHPTGFLGTLAGLIMGRTGVAHNRWAVSHLSITPGDQILEIGFGPGVSIQMLAERATGGYVAGIDPSDEMVRQACRRIAPMIETGRVALHKGSVSALPFENNRFDKVLSVNNIMMWPEIHADLCEVFRVMRPGGLFVVSLNPRWAKSTDDVSEMGQEIVSHVTRAGFVQEEIQMRTDLKPFGAVSVSVRKPKESR